MKRVIGYSLFWFSIGMLVMLLLPYELLGILIIIAGLLLGYNLFCC